MERPPSPSPPRQPPAKFTLIGNPRQLRFYALSARPLRSYRLNALLLPMRRMAPLIRHFRKTLWLALEHDVLNTAKAAAYSGMLMLFPALVVLTTLLAQVPQGPRGVGGGRPPYEQFLPADSMDLLQYSLHPRRILSVQLVLSGTGLSAFAALGVMLSLLEGFRRAYRLPRDEWGFWERRARALLLIFIALVPLA